MSTEHNLFDRFVLILGIVQSFTTLPQLYEIWIKGQVAGVSVITWASFKKRMNLGAPKVIRMAMVKACPTESTILL